MQSHGGERFAASAHSWPAASVGAPSLWGELWQNPHAGAHQHAGGDARIPQLPRPRDDDGRRTSGPPAGDGGASSPAGPRPVLDRTGHRSVVAELHPIVRDGALVARRNRPHDGRGPRCQRPRRHKVRSSRGGRRCPCLHRHSPLIRPRRRAHPRLGAGSLAEASPAQPPPGPPCTSAPTGARVRSRETRTARQRSVGGSTWAGRTLTSQRQPR